MGREIGPREKALQAMREATYQQNHSPAAERREKARQALTAVTERPSKPKATKGRKKAKPSQGRKSTAKPVE